MKATFTVRNKSYELELGPTEKGEGEKFEPYRASVRGQNGGSVEGTLKLTPETLDHARGRAEREGGSVEDLLARACARSLAAEVLIRRLKPDFSFIVDHRWVDEV